MYRVVHFIFDSTKTERTLFRSYSATECWDFVRNHLTVHNTTVNENAMHYVVLDSFNKIQEAPIEILSLKKFLKMKKAA